MKVLVTYTGTYTHLLLILTFDGMVLSRRGRGKSHRKSLVGHGFVGGIRHIARRRRERRHHRRGVGQVRMVRRHGPRRVTSRRHVA